MRSMIIPSFEAASFRITRDWTQDHLAKTQKKNV